MQASNRHLIAVYTAQYCSAFADNALLITAIALLKSMEQSQQIPWLQSLFVLPFVLLAPFVGVFADSLPKGRVMMLGNGLKLIGATSIIMGLNPLLGYAIVGIGAAIYSPAKYGILAQLVPNEKLVKANAWMEGSTLVAILTGVVIGGLLADWSIEWSLFGITLVYGLATIINLAIPKLSAERPYQGESLTVLLLNFKHQLSALWRHPTARTTLLGTSAFWATGSTLRLMLFAWVPVALFIDDNQLPATLMGMVSIGIMLGAGLAAFKLNHHQLYPALLGGLFLSPLLFALAFTSNISIAIALLVGIGIAGGWFIVPLNAALQHHGLESIGSGRAIAVQNLWENVAMFLAVSLYGLIISHVDVINLMMLLSLGLASVLIALTLRMAQKQQTPD